MSKSVIETLKELVKANGNQAATILDAIIQALEQGGGGTVIPGQNGDVLLSDGEGGVTVKSGKVYVDDANKLNVDGFVGCGALDVNSQAVIGGGCSVRGDAEVGDKSDARGIYLRDTTDPTAQYYVTITNGQLTATLVQ